MLEPFGRTSGNPPDKQQLGGICTDDVSEEKVLSNAPQWLFTAGYFGEQPWLM